MYIHGHFYNDPGDRVEVHILTLGDRTEEVEIGSEGSNLCWTADPVEITSEVNDTFDHLLCQQASVRLLAKNFVPDFFCVSCRYATVNIYRGKECLFAGFVEPQAYSQGYNEEYDEIELSCIDALSALQYSKYRNVGSFGVHYGIEKSEAGMRTFHEIMTGILAGITGDLDIRGNQTIRILYDGSKATDNAASSRYLIFKQLTISELLFFGDKEDEMWQQDTVLEEMLKYLNLHIVQDGLTFYIFSWETVWSDSPISWRNIVNGQVALTSRKNITIETAIAAGCDTQISIGEVYNQILLTCETKEVETVIESPLDEDMLKSPYVNKQKYCTEYSADGDGKTAYRAFYEMCHDQTTDYGAGRITTWFVQVMANKQWRFPKSGNTSMDLIDLYCRDGRNQQTLPNWLGSNPGAAILSIGSVEMNTAKDDNSPTSKVSMANVLAVSVNGNGKDGENECYPGDNDLKSGIPYAVYTGSSAGGNFSPADDETTNYIVLSGKVALNPLMEMTDAFKPLHDANEYTWHKANLFGRWKGKVVPSRDNDDGRYYTRKYWCAENPNDEAVWDESTGYGLVPFTGKGPELYEFKYSAIGDSSDTVSKVAVLACMLIIGDKCVVETGTQGQPADFKWRPYKAREECGSDDEYYRQSFTIGFDPKIGDKLIGTEFDLQNNISYTMGIDAEGTAIPIRRTDRVSGQVRFLILGPVNTIWDEITRRHPTFFRHTRWGSNSVPLLAHVSNIMVKSFEVKVYSNNALTNNTGDSDLIYMSDTREEFTNKKDNLEFRICSALTSIECRELGVANVVSLSTPQNTSTGDGILDIYDHAHGIQAKPERLYVDSYYAEYHLPRILMEQKLLDSSDIIGLFNHYTHTALGKAFFVQGISRNLTEGRADLTLKEIGE